MTYQDWMICIAIAQFQVHILILFAQHVLKDRRVLAMVQKRVAEEEGKELSSEWQEDIVTYVS